METDSVGKVLVSVTVENLEDLFAERDGRRDHEDVRRLEIENALVDTGATMLSMPGRLIRELGLTRHRSRDARTANGMATFDIYSPVRLTIQDRDCVIEVAELPDDCPTLIGQIPLEMLDFVVDMPGQRLIGNPEHGGEHMIEVY